MWREWCDVPAKGQLERLLRPARQRMALSFNQITQRRTFNKASTSKHCTFSCHVTIYFQAGELDSNTPRNSKARLNPAATSTLSHIQSSRIISLDELSGPAYAHSHSLIHLKLSIPHHTTFSRWSSALEQPASPPPRRPIPSSRHRQTATLNTTK